MRALVKDRAAPGLTLKEVPKPTISERQVLIKVKKAAICGTDLHIYKWNEWAQKTIPVGTTTGHEFMGEVVEKGSAVTQEIAIGQRVSVESHIYCRQCINCQEGRRHLCLNLHTIGLNYNGGFADYVAVPARSVYPMPDFISDDVAAMCDPLGNAVHVASEFRIAGEDVVVTGAGPIGTVTAMICQQLGAHSVILTDISQPRLDAAEKLGVKQTVNTKDHPLAAYIGKSGFFIGLETSGSPIALNTLIDEITPGGRIALLGIVPDQTGVNWTSLIFKGLTVQGIYGRQIFTNWNKLMRLLESGLSVEGIITHKYPLEQYETAFETALSGKAGKVILEL